MNSTVDSSIDNGGQRGCAASVNTDMETACFYSQCGDEAVIRARAIAAPCREPVLVGNTHNGMCDGVCNTNWVTRV